MHIISGGLDSQLKLFDLNSNTETLLGSHDDSIKCVEFSAKVNGVATGSWDKVSTRIGRKVGMKLMRFGCRR